MVQARLLWQFAIQGGAALAIVLAAPALVIAVHGAWQDHYQSYEQGSWPVPCCGMRDCIKVRARILAQMAQWTQVEVNGVSLILDARSVHRSETEHDWACTMYREGQPVIEQGTVRCVFLAPGA